MSSANAPKPNQTANVIAFLAILVERAGGTLTIPRLSEFGGRTFKLGIEVDHKNDSVTLTVGKEEEPRQ